MEAREAALDKYVVSEITRDQVIDIVEVCTDNIKRLYEEGAAV